jgi:hypothetical protein
VGKRSRHRSGLNAADSFIGDAALTNVSEGTQLRCAFNACYLSLVEVALEIKAIAKEPRIPDVQLLTSAFDAINAPKEDQLMTLRIQQWLDVFDPAAPMPCSLADAIALAKRTVLGARHFLKLQ